MKILYINLILNIISRALNNCSIILMNNFGWVAPRGNFLNMIVGLAMALYPFDSQLR